MKTIFYLRNVPGGCTFRDLFDYATEELNGEVCRTIKGDKLAIKIGETVLINDGSSYIFSRGAMPSHYLSQINDNGELFFKTGYSNRDYFEII